MKKTLPAILGCALLCLPAVSAEEAAGFIRLSETPGEDTAPLNDESRFTDISLDEHVGFRGVVSVASANTIAALGAFWKPDQFVYSGDDQPRHYYVEIVTGTAAGTKFDIDANSGNALTVNLAGGSLAGIVASDEIRVVSKWSLDLLFPDGGILNPSTDSVSGTEVRFPTSGPGGVDYSGVPIFQYRSDLGRWIDSGDPATDAGDLPIPVGSLVSIHQPNTDPLDFLFSGFQSHSGSPLALDVSLVGDEVPDLPEITVEQPANTDLTDGSASIAFGSVATNSSSQRTFTIRNDGTASLTGLGATIDGANSADFSAGALSAMTLEPNETATFTITFSPGVPGSRSASLHIASNDSDENPFDIALGGTGMEPPIDNFADAFAINGAGNRSVDTTGSTGEANEPQHAGNTTTASLWFRYTAEEEGTLTVRTENADYDTILAAYSGSSLANLQLIAENDDKTPGTTSEVAFIVAAAEDYWIALDGKNGATGTADLVWEFQAGLPEITVEQPTNSTLTDEASTISFGNVETGMSSQRTFTIRNTGTADLSGLSASVDGTNQAEFTASALSATTLQTGAAATFTVTFSPGDTGSRTAALHIASNDVDENPFDIALSGTGAAPPINLDPPTNVMATDGIHDGEVRISWDASNGATEYEIYRGTSADGNGAVLVGSTSATTFTDSDGNIDENYYYFVKAKTDSLTSELSTGEIGYHATPVPILTPVYQPDGLVGKKSNALVGNNAYSSGAGQEVKQTSKKSKKLTWYFEVQNDGNTADQLAMSLTTANKDFKVILRSAGGGNMTAAANTGTLPALLTSGQATQYKFEVKPSKKAKGKAKKRTFVFSTASTSDGIKVDSVNARAQTKK